METTQPTKNIIERTLPLFLAIVTVIVVIFLSQLVIDMRQDMKELRKEITSLQQEPVMAANFEPFSALEQNCTRCHTERRFMGIHGSPDDIHAIIKHMETNPDLKLAAEDVDKVHAAMNLLKCTQCHDEMTIKKFGALNTAMQRSILKRMEEKPGTTVQAADERTIQRSIQTIQGF